MANRWQLSRYLSAVIIGLLLVGPGRCLGQELWLMYDSIPRHRPEVSEAKIEEPFRWWLEEQKRP